MARDFVTEARAAGVRDERVLAALGAVDRSRFAPPDAGWRVDRDAPVPLPCEQTTSQPSLIALMVEALEVARGARVLEVGTGYGFEAAVLAELTGPTGEVWTLERWPELAAEARTRLAAYPQVQVVTADGSDGLPAHAPYAGIVVAARCTEVPDPLVAQLAPGGRLVAPIGAEGREHCLVLRRPVLGRTSVGPDDDEPRAEVVADLGAVRFVPLVRGHPGI